jgi:hypothetical protein
VKIDQPSTTHAAAGADFLRRETGHASWAIVNANDDGFSLTCRHCGQIFQATMEATAQHYERRCVG